MGGKQEWPLLFKRYYVVSQRLKLLTHDRQNDVYVDFSISAIYATDKGGELIYTYWR